MTASAEIDGSWPKSKAVLRHYHSLGPASSVNAGVVALRSRVPCLLPLEVGSSEEGGMHLERGRKEGAV